MEISFRSKFKNVSREIELLKLKVHQKEGILFFTSHVHSQEELLNSEHHQKIDSVTKKIGDDARNWERLGKLSSYEKYSYEKHENEVQDELHSVNVEIVRRQPTWWENVKGGCEKFIILIMTNLKLDSVLLLKMMKPLLNLPGPIGAVAKFMLTKKDDTKLLK